MLYAAKCYWPGVTEDDLRQACDRPLFRGLLYLRTDDTALTLFEANTPASVKEASERVIATVWFAPPSDHGRNVQPKGPT